MATDPHIGGKGIEIITRINGTVLRILSMLNGRNWPKFFIFNFPIK
jgi:hypothetical protein